MSVPVLVILLPINVERSSRMHLRGQAPLRTTGKPQEPSPFITLPGKPKTSNFKNAKMDETLEQQVVEL